MKYVINVEEIPPSLNRVIFVAKKHWSIYAGMKKSWKKLINDKLNPNWLPFENKVNVVITYYFADNRKRDPDNYTAKFILDGLTKKDNPDKFILYDDSNAWISSVTIKIRKGETKYTNIVVQDTITD